MSERRRSRRVPQSMPIPDGFARAAQEIITAHFQTIQAPIAHSAQEPATDDRHPSEIPVVETEIGRFEEILAAGMRDAQALALSDEQLQRARNALRQLDHRDGSAVPGIVQELRRTNESAERQGQIRRVRHLILEPVEGLAEAVEGLQFELENPEVWELGPGRAIELVKSIQKRLERIIDRIATDPELFPQQPKVTNPVTDTGPVSAARFSGLVDEREEDA